MNILLIEDNLKKSESIIDYIRTTIGATECNIKKAETLRVARQEILSKPYDLIIFDLYLPVDPGKNEEDISEDIIRDFSESKNYQTEAILITAYSFDDITNINFINEKGITVVQYQNDEKWKKSLNLKINKIKDKLKFDFLIFCALLKEREAYSKTEAIIEEHVKILGIDCQKITINGVKGLCILPNKMGLVSMAVTSSKAIEAFQPKVVAMSGICAGIEKEVNILDLVVGDICWEHQSGKHIDQGFNSEQHQSRIPDDIKTQIKQYIYDSTNLEKIKLSLFQTELEHSKVILAPISSGSAVIASAEKMREIGSQHSKLAAVEMEMYSLYEAAYQSLCRPDFFGVKAVVDLGDTTKGDEFHITGSIISARFTVDFLSHYLSTP